ncbi:hypothetical protein [Halorussus sp. MSC15.2]|uniref:hypothetical protein n=1 Tax=Halorussus sp. MSC15.2 TaxID=2283638 RepID=UPI0013D49178|nr:hypothetical protein [Halorussus sp. MSC15.2]NEU57459.1 hypothetical protein [Halorussus sp. MSC15.2]
MRLRRPEPRHVPLSLGLLAGFAGFLATPGPWPTDPVLGIGLGACVTVVVWAALEQRPDALDRAVEARAQWVLAGLGLLPAAAVFGPPLFGAPTPPEGTSVRVLVFTFAVFVVAAMGEQHRGMLLLGRGQVRGRVVAVKSKWRQFALGIAVATVTLFVISHTIAGSFSIWSLVGTVVGMLIGNGLTGTEEYELVALDDHLLVRQRGGWGATAIPWRRLGDVTVEGATLRIARGPPYFSVYTADLSSVSDRRAAVEAFRTYPSVH